MSETAENVEKSTVPTIQACEEIQEFFKMNSLLTRACIETELEYKAAKRSMNGPASKMKLIHAIVLTKWVALWRAAEIERQALSGVVKGVVGE